MVKKNNNLKHETASVRTKSGFATCVHAPILQPRRQTPDALCAPLERVHDPKKKTPVPFESEVPFALWPGAQLLLVTLPLQEFALLVLAHFLASLLDHAPHSITSSCVPELGAFPFSVCFSSTWTNGDMHPFGPGKKLERLSNPSRTPTKMVVGRPTQARIQITNCIEPDFPSRGTRRGTESLGPSQPERSPAGSGPSNALQGVVCTCEEASNHRFAQPRRPQSARIVFRQKKMPLGTGIRLKKRNPAAINPDQEASTFFVKALSRAVGGPDQECRSASGALHSSMISRM